VSSRRDDGGWNGDELAARELQAALGEARARVPDEVTLRRMWARVAEIDVNAAADADVAVDPKMLPVADDVRLRATRTPRCSP
jgi:hypothetical protein